MRTRTGVLSAIVASVMFAAPALAAGLATVSGPSPYAGCSDANQRGTNFENAEVEPNVAVNPATVGTAHVNVIGAWQQDRWSNGGSHGLVAGFSNNGGQTWNEVTLPFSACAPNAILDPFTQTPYSRGSDPWVSIGPDGTAYAVGLEATQTNLGVSAGNNDTAVATVTSSDGGKTWGNPNIIKADRGTSPVFEITQFFNDKESITADPLHAGTAYVVWDRLVSPSGTLQADARAHAFRGPTWFSKTTDGGVTWHNTGLIFDPGQNSQTIGNQIVVDPTTGALYDFFLDFQSTGAPDFTPRGASLDVITSTDGGLTWSKPTLISNVKAVADVDPNTGDALRTSEIGGGAIPSVAVDATTGQLYVVWEDARFTGGAVNQVVISTSANGAKTWSSPAVVSTVTDRPAFTPTVAVKSDGTVGVTYYDLRNLQAGNTTSLPTDLWLKTSPRGGAAFGVDTHVAGSFNLLVAPNAGGFFLGDYQGMAANGTKFLPFFVQTNCTDNSCTSNRTDVYAGSF
jgi:hypothetical protein